MTIANQEYRWPCPVCAEKILWDAQACRFCNAVITNADREKYRLALHDKQTQVQKERAPTKKLEPVEYKDENTCGVCNRTWIPEKLRRKEGRPICVYCLEGKGPSVTAQDPEYTRRQATDFNYWMVAMLIWVFIQFVVQGSDHERFNIKYFFQGVVLSGVLLAGSMAFLRMNMRKSHSIAITLLGFLISMAGLIAIAIARPLLNI